MTCNFSPSFQLIDVGDIFAIVRLDSTYNDFVLVDKDWLSIFSPWQEQLPLDIKWNYSWKKLVEWHQTLKLRGKFQCTLRSRDDIQLTFKSGWFRCRYNFFTFFARWIYRLINNWYAWILALGSKSELMIWKADLNSILDSLVTSVKKTVSPLKLPAISIINWPDYKWYIVIAKLLDSKSYGLYVNAL